MPIHICNGNAHNKIAFILSVSGKLEGEAELPAIGDTGKNMNAILEILNINNPVHFPSIDRYQYLITNASTKVIHSGKDNGKSEDLNSNITEHKNVNRILREVEKHTIVILCGEKAKLLAPYLSA